MELGDLFELTLSGRIVLDENDEPIPDEEALKYAYAAYRRGGLEDIERGLNPTEFTKAVTLASIRAISAGGRIIVFRAKTPRGKIPVGFAVLGGLEPELIWFPEASLRNRIECLLKLLAESKGDVFLFWAKGPDLPYFQHICKYGSLRGIGKSRGLDSTLFESVIS